MSTRPKQFTLTVDDTHKNQRIDILLAHHFSDISRNMWQSHIKLNKVFVDGELTKTSDVLKAGQLITGELPLYQESVVENLKPRELPEIIFEDDDVLVINKPAGLLCYSAQYSQKSVVGAFQDKISDTNTEKPGIVHRLDKDTSGVMILAKNTNAREFLQREFKTRQVTKIYTTLVYGHLKNATASIDLPIARSKTNRLKMSIHAGGKTAKSSYKVLNTYREYSLLQVQIYTGRTHQIRVQFAYIGHAVVGDSFYSEKPLPAPLKRQFLHASSLGITLPSGVTQTFSAPLAADLQHFLRHLS